MVIFEQIKSSVNAWIPEGPVKDHLRILKRNLSQSSETWRYNHSKGLYVLNLLEEPLRGQHIFFPDCVPLTRYIWIGTDLKGYFMDGDLSPGSLVVDAGAWPGDFTTIASNKVGPDGKVLALEPDASNRQYLEKVVEANHLKNVIILPYCLSDIVGEARLAGNYTGARLIDNYVDDGRIVQAATLDFILAQYDDFPGHKVVVKQDIEGAEIAAFKGSENALKNGARFMIACYHKVGGVKTAEILPYLFEQAGYAVRLGYKEHLTLYARPK